MLVELYAITVLSNVLFNVSMGHTILLLLRLCCKILVKLFLSRVLKYNPTAFSRNLRRDSINFKEYMVC